MDSDLAAFSTGDCQHEPRTRTEFFLLQLVGHTQLLSDPGEEEGTLFGAWTIFSGAAT